MLAISPLVVSNNILELAFRENIPITPMKLQKLLYFLYKEFLQKTHDSLFTEKFEAWKYGPVLPSVYSQFSGYRDKSIDKYYKDSNGKSYKIDTVDKNFNDALRAVWCKYRDFNGIELSNFTHEKGTAWYKAWMNNSDFLIDEDIISETVG